MSGIGHNHPPEIIDLSDYYHVQPHERPFVLLKTNQLGQGMWFRLPNDRKFTGYQIDCAPGAIVTIYGSMNGRFKFPIRHARYEQAFSHHEEWPLLCADYRLYTDPCVMEIPPIEVTCHWGM